MSASLPIWLNIFSQIVVIFLLSQLSLSLVWYFSKSSIRAMRSQWQYFLLWLMVSLPWLISISCFLLAMNNDAWPPDNNFLQPYFHWHHPFSFSWQSWHGLSLITSLLICVYLCGKAYTIAHNYKKQDAKRRILSQLTCNQHGHFEHVQALAFTSGLLRPNIYISTGLAQQLSPSELAIVKLHEQAHANSYDPLQKWLFLLAASFFPRIIARQLMSTMNLNMELRADQKVAQQHDVLNIAEALIKVARVMNSPSQQVEQRLQYLITPPADFFSALFWKKTLALPIFVLLLQLSLPLLTVVFGMDFFHHLFDQWLWHFTS